MLSRFLCSTNIAKENVELKSENKILALGASSKPFVDSVVLPRLLSSFLAIEWESGRSGDRSPIIDSPSVGRNINARFSPLSEYKFYLPFSSHLTVNQSSNVCLLILQESGRPNTQSCVGLSCESVFRGVSSVSKISLWSIMNRTFLSPFCYTCKIIYEL